MDMTSGSHDFVGPHGTCLDETPCHTRGASTCSSLLKSQNTFGSALPELGSVFLLEEC